MIVERILFRVDGNAFIGAGHIMRCLSIAMAARDEGIECEFLMADESFLNVIDDNGFKSHILYSAYYKLDDEINKIVPIIEKCLSTVIFVDSYYVTEYYFSQLGKIAPIAYIDDIKAFAYKVDYLINYNAFAYYLDYPSYYKEYHISNPQLMLGETYAPLRKEFQNLDKIDQKKNVTDILFTAGGADPERIALAFATTVVNESKLKKYKFHLVLGAYEPDVTEIKQLAEQESRLCIHENVKKISDVMRLCDIAVSAAGSTIYELCACGIPTITYILEDNQILGANSLADKGAVINSGDFRTENKFFQKLIGLVCDLCMNYHLRVDMQNKAVSVTDGNGAKNIISELIGLNKNRLK